MLHDADEIHYGRSDGNRSGHRVRDSPRLEPGYNHEKRHVQHFAIQRCDMKTAAVIEKLFAMVGEHDEYRVVEKPATFELAHDLAHITVGPMHRRVILRDIRIDPRGIAFGVTELSERLLRHCRRQAQRYAIDRIVLVRRVRVIPVEKQEKFLFLPRAVVVEPVTDLLAIVAEGLAVAAIQVEAAI